MSEPIQSEERDERPPIFATWTGLYAFVLAFLALLVLAMVFFGRAFS